MQHLKDRGYWVQGADVKRLAYGNSAADEFDVLHLRRLDSRLVATRPASRGAIDEIYHLAADMGGIG